MKRIIITYLLVLFSTPIIAQSKGEFRFHFNAGHSGIKSRTEDKDLSKILNNGYSLGFGFEYFYFKHNSIIIDLSYSKFKYDYYGFKSLDSFS